MHQYGVDDSRDDECDNHDYDQKQEFVHFVEHMGRNADPGEEFFDSEQKPMRTYCLWEDVQAQCFSIIKGKRTPLNFKIVFQLSSSNVEKLLSQSGIALKPEDIYGLYLNCQFDGKQLLCTTGTSLKIFTLDKQLDRVWDEMVRKFFRKNQVAFEDA